MSSDLTSSLTLLAEGKQIDEESWLAIQEPLIARIEKNVQESFQIPIRDEGLGRDADAHARSKLPGSSPQIPKPETNGANHSSPRLGPSSNPTQEEEAAESLVNENANSISTASISLSQLLPQTLYILLMEVEAILKSSFPHSPPYTAQRFAELVLFPQAAYKTLPAYLRALHRVVNVASPLNAFPLPTTSPEDRLPNSEGMNVAASIDTLRENASDGPQLVEIPWLINTHDNDTIEDQDARLPEVMRPVPNNMDEDGHKEGLMAANTNDRLSSYTAFAPGAATDLQDAAISSLQVEAPEQTHLAHTTESSSIPGSTHVGSPERVGHSHHQSVIETEEPRPGSESDAGEATNIETKNDFPPGNERELSSSAESTHDSDDTVHARGPNLIGIEDMGPQPQGSGLEDGITMEETGPSPPTVPKDHVDTLMKTDIE